MGQKWIDDLLLNFDIGMNAAKSYEHFLPSVRVTLKDASSLFIQPGKLFNPQIRYITGFAFDKNLTVQFVSSNSNLVNKFVQLTILVTACFNKKLVHLTIVSVSAQTKSEVIFLGPTINLQDGIIWHIPWICSIAVSFSNRKIQLRASGTVYILKSNLKSNHKTI